MLVTVTNTSGGNLNAPAAITGGPSGVPWALNATGGSKEKPLPFPFGHIGTLANAGTKQLPMKLKDWDKRGGLNAGSFTAGMQWQDLVQRGFVTLTIADETANRSQHELFVTEI